MKFKTLYERFPTENDSFWKILKWWELRRLPYNIFVLIFINLEYGFISWIFNIPGGGSPIILLALMFAGFVGLNLLYMAFYALDIISNQRNLPVVPQYRQKLFLISLGTPCFLFTIALTLLVINGLVQSYF
jgi:hypothetical protein